MSYKYIPIQSNTTPYQPNVKYIYHHLGLGDHIILNGLVRCLIQDINTNYYLFCKLHNEPSVSFMYNDLPNIRFVTVKDDIEVNNILQKIHRDNVIKIGFENLGLNLKDQYFDKAFYSQFNLPIKTKWENFYINRDLDKENKLFQSLNIEKGKYVFLHEDTNRGFKINQDLIQDKSLPIIEPYKTDTIFDWCTVIENAAEIHCICSSFKNLADNLDLKTDKLYYHISYINKGKPKDVVISYNKNNWRNI